LRLSAPCRRFVLGDGGRETYVYCGPVVNGVELDQPHCRTVDQCIKQILEEYRREVERLKEPPKPPPPDMAEELLKEYPELQAFGVDWVRKWAILKERLVEIAKVLRRFPWMVDVVRQRPMSILHPYAVEVYVAGTGRRRVSRSPVEGFLRTGRRREGGKAGADLQQYETYEDKMREVYRPKGLLAYAAAAREYVNRFFLTSFRKAFYIGNRRLKLKRLAEAAGATPASVRNAANRIRIRRRRRSGPWSPFLIAAEAGGSLVE
jgi:hypothetical protein